MTQKQSSDGCLRWWAEENADVVRRWKAANSSGDEDVLRVTVTDCHLALKKLLQKVQGLPAAVLSLPLELAILCNSIVFSINVTGGFTDQDGKAIHQGLLRVLETSCPSRSKLSCAELWPRILRDVKAEELDPSLHQLAGLQAALWLASNQIQDFKALFQLLNTTQESVSGKVCPVESDLLELLSLWNVPEEGTSGYLMAETTHNLKDMLYTAAAFQQGLQLMEAGDLSAAVGILQKAAAGMCSTRVLAQIFTAIGSCYQRMSKPQAALQCWKQALQVDFRCLSALYQTSQLYHQLGKMDAELQALQLLYEALDDSKQEASSVSPVSLVRTEYLVKIPHAITIFCSHDHLEVKYLIARRYLQVGRVEEAVEHYLDLLALLHEGSSVFLNSLFTFPRIPEVYLEAASALMQQKRFQDALTICEEIIDKTKDLIPERLNIEQHSETQSPAGAHEQTSGSSNDGLDSPHPEDLPGLCQEKRESLRCILWASAAHLFQGQALARLHDCKESITQFSRSINLLFKVQLVKSDSDTAVYDPPGPVNILETLKALALLGRGVQFLEMGKEKEALMNLQLCLQVSPGHREAMFCLLNVLWKLNRKPEAASYWQKFQSTQETAERTEAAARYLPLYLVPHLKGNIPQEEIVKTNIQEYLQTNTKDSSF
ncbi:Fanconi anemia group G protein [Pleurodeles waltl]|uniref:Fanconi anemia group G protein n=1 Tax=Pleurodeles waltl TaxID=8319 RepID=UPI003709861E